MTRSDIVRSQPKLAGGWRLWRLVALRSAGLPFEMLGGLAVTAERPVDAAAPIEAQTSVAISDLLRDATFRAALTWQNPELVRNWVGGHVRAGQAGSLSRGERIRREAVIARYAQRYCAKNDTIGFFGPVAWAVLGDGPTGYVGTGGIRHRAVSFETWAIQAVAEAWNNDPDLLPHLPVRLAPACTIVGDQAHRPLRTPMPLSEEDRRLLDVLPCAGSVAALLEISGLAEAEAGAALAVLRDGQVVQVGFLVPLDTMPERHLARQVDRIADPVVRERLSTVLGDLDGVAAVAARASDPEPLLAALGEADRRLAKVTGLPARHRTGQAGGGRTPLYLDCRRDLDATIGVDLLDALSVPLSILLDSARWLTGQVGEVVEDALLDRYRVMRSRRDKVSLADLQLAAADVLSGADGLLADVVSDFQMRWAEILPTGDDDAVVSARHARRLADSLFPAAGRWWAAARTHSPDLMVRRSPNGALSWVLGELHVALNTLENRFFGAQADDRDELVAAVAADAAPGRVVPVYPNTSAEVSSRTYPPPSLDPPGHYRYWSYGKDAGHSTGAPSTAATALRVREHHGRLVASGDGWAAPVLECFGEFVTALAVNLFQLRAPRPFAPRASIGQLTVCRRTWRIPVAQIGTVPLRSADPAHDRLCGWAVTQGMPRHVFVRTARHPKPFYVDFAAPVLVDNLARALRRVERDTAVEVVEMLPAPDELWLSFGDNLRYTSELRLVAVDPVAPGPASWPYPEMSTSDAVDGRMEEAHA